MRLGFVCGGIGLLAQLSAAEFEEVTLQEIVFVKIPPGSFLMGTSDPVKAQLESRKLWSRFEEVERPAHSVHLTKGFLIGKLEVTQKQWAAVTGKPAVSIFHGPDLPADSVSWQDAQTFLSALNKKEGRNRFRLPSEAEWEYCCRAGGEGAYGLGSEGEEVTAEKLGDYAWLAANAGNRSHPVGTKKPNAWKLHDLHGNVWEWCLDFFDPKFYASAAPSNPLNSDGKNFSERVLRGGSWFLGAANLRAGYRSASLPEVRNVYIGLRIVAEL